jgi:CubicO group peptidase (beta-lactamase class C family)
MGTFEGVEEILQRGLDSTAPAIALAVSLRGEILVERSYGYLDPDTRQRPTTHTTRFDLASVTKLYTTTAFLMLIGAGRIALDDPVVNVIPEFGRSGPRTIEGGQNPHTLERETAGPSGVVDPAQITFRHLLTHTSGLAPWRDLFLNVGLTPPAPEQGLASDGADRLTRALELIGSYPFVSAIGERVNYSDLGLILLGTAVARLDDTGTLPGAIGKFASAETYFNPTASARFSRWDYAPTECDTRWRNRRCWGEVHDENACALGGVAGHAGLFAPAISPLRLGQLWLDALAGQVPLLPADLAREAVRDQARGGYRGLGWVIRSPEGSSSGRYFSPSSFGHTGFTGTSLWIDPERELIVSLMTNRVYFGRDHDDILRFRPAIHDAIAQWVNAL